MRFHDRAWISRKWDPGWVWGEDYIFSYFTIYYRRHVLHACILDINNPFSQFLPSIIASAFRSLSRSVFSQERFWSFVNRATDVLREEILRQIVQNGSLFVSYGTIYWNLLAAGRYVVFCYKLMKVNEQSFKVNDSSHCRLMTSHHFSQCAHHNSQTPQKEEMQEKVQHFYIEVN